ncbi:MAG: carbohydrate porin [Acidibrevibacterium sp.]|uniref:carbohydrate porin n=1 Tax=Acidibrevibacterium sp. TaxID=2606776 RepID=UPI003D077E95
MPPLRPSRAAPFAAALLWLLPGLPAAFAQSATAPAAASDTAWQSGYLFDFSTFGSSSGVGQAMANAGIYLNGGETGILAGNVSGGAKQGSVFDNDFELEVDLDMARIAGIPGAAMHIVVDDRVGGYYGGFSGSNTLTPQTFGPNEVLQFQEFDWDQSLFNDHVLLLIGRQSPVFDFNSLPVACNFVFTNACTNFTAFFVNDSAAIAPASTWGARISIHPTSETYLRAGIYEDDPYAYTQASNLTNNWGFGHASGSFVPVELGYKTDFPTDSYPRVYAIGGFYDDSPYPDPLFNGAGLPLPIYGGTARQDQGRESLYAMFQQMIWRPDLSETRRGLTVFGGTMFGSNQSEIRQYYQAGLSDQGPFASHPHDSVNFLVMYQVFNQRLVEDQTLLANLGGYPGRTNKGETDFELNYLWQVGAGVSIQPFVEYIINPDQIGFAVPNPRLANSTTLGMQFAIALPDSLGLPVFVRKN